MDVIVFGSINMDLVARTPRLPATGETIIGKQFETLLGGKGANQAVAVAQLGSSVRMIGKVGGDAFGPSLIQGLQNAGVTCDRLTIVPNESSGVAVIEVDDQGENRIIVIPGANNQVGAEDVQQLRECVGGAKVVLLQLEVPLESVVAAAETAATAGATVILDPAPAPSTLPDALFHTTHILTPNQSEAEQLVGFSVNTLEDAERAGRSLLNRGVETVIVKLGAQGSLCVTAQEVIHTPGFTVDVVDTVAAGDAFNGGFAVALAEGRSLRNSLTWATAVAALAVSRSGAQSAMPTRADLHTFFTEQDATL